MRLRRSRDTPSPWAFFKDVPRIFPYLRTRKRLAGLSLSLVAAGSVTALLAPWPLAIMIDTVLGNKPLPAILGVLGGFSRYQLLAIAVAGGLLVTGLQHGLAVVDNYVNTRLDQGMVLDLRSDMFRHAQRLSLAFHDRTRTGQLMFEINNQASAVGAIAVAIPPLLQSLFTVVGMFLILVRIEPTLALLSLTVVPPIYISAGYYAKRIQPRVMDVRHLESMSLTIVHEAMTMMKVIVAFGREGHEWRRFRKQGEQAVAARVNLTVRQTLFSLVVTMTTAIGSSLVLGFGAYFVLQHKLTAGELLVVIGYVAALYAPLEQISNTVSALQEQFITLRGALKLLDTDPEIHEKPNAISIGRAQGHVKLESVSFSYVGRRGTLADVSLDAPRGTRVAIVGPTGAGKSTLLSLIPRFYDTQRGRVLLDGHDVRDLTLKSLRAQVSMVLQEPLLFSGTLGDNIRYGRLEATDDEVIEAARAANAHDFISALPHGYGTMIGERGARLSGGERQRVSVARAFLKDAPILILDEPTSSIDSQTETVILEALQRLMEGRTTFMVAHRLSTVIDADLILVLNHGEIAEQGTHDHLLTAGGLYTELHAAQSGRRRGQAAAVVSEEHLSELTSAIVEGRESGAGLSGPALAELARAMSTRDDADQDAVWALLSAVWPLLSDGSTERLRELAATNGSGGEASQLARQLLLDLGLEQENVEAIA
jgi:ATP-binding cassette subfamily B protein/subfamily B ATP-binding cassette protein MsbA